MSNTMKIAQRAWAGIVAACNRHMAEAFSTAIVVLENGRGRAQARSVIAVTEAEQASVLATAKTGLEAQGMMMDILERKARAFATVEAEIRKTDADLKKAVAEMNHKAAASSKETTTMKKQFTSGHGTMAAALAPVAKKIFTPGKVVPAPTWAIKAKTKGALNAAARKAAEQAGYQGYVPCIPSDQASAWAEKNPGKLAVSYPGWVVLQ